MSTTELTTIAGPDVLTMLSAEALAAADSQTLYALEQAGEISRSILDGRVTEWTKAGWSQAQIADELGCSKQAVSKRQGRLNVRSRNEWHLASGGGDNRVVPRAERRPSSQEMGSVLAADPSVPAMPPQAGGPVEAVRGIVWSQAQIRKDARALDLLLEAREARDDAQRLHVGGSIARAYREAAKKARNAAREFDAVAQGFE